MSEYDSGVPKDDDEARAAIRRCGDHPDMIASMIGLFDVQRAQGVPLLKAYELTLLASLSDESLRRVDSMSCREELARRDVARAR